MDFEEMVTALREKREDVPETIYDDLSQAYRLTVDGSTAAVQSRQQQLDEAQAEIQRLKAQNFELLMRAPAVDSDDKSGDDESGPKPQGIDSLFRIG